MVAGSNVFPLGWTNDTRLGPVVSVPDPARSMTSRGPTTRTVALSTVVGAHQGTVPHKRSAMQATTSKRLRSRQRGRMVRPLSGRGLDEVRLRLAIGDGVPNARGQDFPLACLVRGAERGVGTKAVAEPD